MNSNSPTGPGNKGKGNASQSPTTTAGSNGRDKAAGEPPTPQKGKRKPTSPPASVRGPTAEASNTAGPSSARPVTPELATGAIIAAGSAPPVSTVPTVATGTTRTAGTRPTTATPGPAPPAGPPMPPAPQSNRSRVRTPFGYSNTFRVLVGKAPNNLVFTLHEDLFCQRSRYFRGQRAWTKLQPKGQPNRLTFTHVTKLPDVDPEVFGHYVAASISGVLEFDEPIDYRGLDWRAYFDLHILADYLGDLRMAHSVIDSPHNRERDLR
ncbi:hypothetical protein B0A48_10413 [Cryoendolithus antarcticus]|uniref:BTB domain-containing protein n=1 Tax=Cryoendolithus antarcticus TaxID=1507870 RepID=A0A1V8SX84_9PEZI|nr:hypothetical protein B0A48_10413 [Cryoendolithus antarcticus]